MSWDDPTTVSFDFIKTGKSKGDGILVTNENSFKLHYSKSTKGGQLQHYVCSHKKEGCQAKALIQRIETEDEAGNKTVQRTLLSVSSPLVHSRSHKPDQAQITADLLVSKMKEEVKKNPLLPVGQAKNKILREELHRKFDESLTTAVLAALPARIENTLSNFRHSVIGKVPSERSEYNPKQVLSTIKDGDKVIPLDSNNLEANWKEVDLNELLKDNFNQVFIRLYSIYIR